MSMSVIKNVSKIYRQTCGPEHPLFKKLQNVFPSLNIDASQLLKYQYGKDHFLDLEAKKSLKVCQELLQQKQLPRGDYTELAKLVCLFLSPEETKIKIKQPAGVSNSRFISQAILSMKIKLLSNQVDVASSEELKNEIDSMSQFVSLYYAKWFLRSSLITASPRLDLEAIWEMKGYEAYKPEVTKKCMTSLTNHSWYLHPSIIPFSLLDTDLTEKERQEIANAIFELQDDGEDETRYVKVDLSTLNLETDDRPTLAEFIDQKSILIFDILGHDKQKIEWTLLPPDMWILMTPFRQFKEFIESISVVNDPAERNIQLVQKFIAGSYDENLRQDLFLAVESKRKSEAEDTKFKKVKH